MHIQNQPQNMMDNFYPWHPSCRNPRHRDVWHGMAWYSHSHLPWLFFENAGKNIVGPWNAVGPNRFFPMELCDFRRTKWQSINRVGSRWLTASLSELSHDISGRPLGPEHHTFFQRLVTWGWSALWDPQAIFETIPYNSLGTKNIEHRWTSQV